MNYTILLIAGIVLIGLVVFLVVRNQKDEKEFEHQLNEDYHKSKEEENDVDTEEILK